MAELDPSEQDVLEKWGSDEAVYTFLQRELERINLKGFEGKLSLPQLQIKPMWLSRGFMGERHSAADYEPAEGDKPATIGVFSVVLLDERDARIALVHEMIHHWEMTVKEESPNCSYPMNVDEMIRQRFSDTMKEHLWRTAHSSRFISKSFEIAICLKISMRDLLFR